MKVLRSHINLLLTFGLVLFSAGLHAQFILTAPGDSDETNYRWYNAVEPDNLLGSERTFEVNVPGVYFATYDGTLCGKNATSYFIVTFCGKPNNEVTLDISSSVPSGATVSWTPAVTGDKLRPTVTADGSVTKYTPYVHILGNKKKLPSFTVVCLQGPFMLVDDLVSIDQDEPVVIRMLDNDVDIPSIGVISYTDPLHGLVSLDDHGTPSDPRDDTFEYLPEPGFSGEDTYTYTLTLINSDGSTMTDTATIKVMVNNINDLPIATNDVLSVYEDSSGGSANQINVALNDDIGYDGGDDDNYDLFTPPNNGVVTEISDGVFEYIPNPNFNGMDSFVYSLTDVDGSQTTAVVTVHVLPVNDDPVAVDDHEDITSGTSFIIVVLDNDYDIDGDLLTVASFDGVDKAEVVLNDDGTFTYTPKPGFTGMDTFTYTISDGNGGSSTATVTINVLSENTVTLAFDDEFEMEEDSEAVLDILQNDAINAGATVIITNVQTPINGEVILNADNTLRFIPEHDFVGVNQFEYTISVTDTDGIVYSGTATVTIKVTPVQDIVNDTANVDSSNPESIVISVFDNDTFHDDTIVTIISISTPIHGTATLNPDGTVSYLVEQSFEGLDVFTYTVAVVHSDGSTNNETGNITITAIRSTSLPAPSPEEEEEELLLVHQLVTPNGDGQNDWLQIDGIELYPDNSVQIFNRWGVRVFETSGYGQGRNYFYGISEGRLTISQQSKLPSGTYYYIINFKDENGYKHNKSGYFYINN
ncbi:Ig-like domain-containing protein [Robertkochia solimangrovi]|uniref:Ig-like domain-containing protein n=1 Tax=Robertkochia solimangrovi TaxID=2213046 RepID=UPI00117CD23F|nr:Ig-like domain-containing protein [Robertkochia solimangrovi]TRZ41772.1 hypothetical protein DMZ48_15605 [Robertkochia solimangrovi]